VNVSQSISTGSRLMVSYKILTSSDPNTTVTGLTGTGGTRKFVLIYRPNSTVTTLSSGAITSQTTPGVATNQIITAATTANTLNTSNAWVPFAVYASSGAITTRGSTITATRELNQSTNLYIKAFEEWGGSNTISIADYGVNALASFWVKGS
jgi:hypothetical protein